MDDKNREFDDVYKSSDHYFGDSPERILVQYADRIDDTRPALDIGTGQGRNAFFLAKRGIEVDAIDPSEEAVGATAAVAGSLNLPVLATRVEFDRFDPSRDGVAGARFDSYGVICLFGLIQLLKPVSIQSLTKKVLEWSGDSTLLFVTAFTSNDPSFPGVSNQWKRIGGLSFAGPGGAVKTYLEPGQAPRLFAGFNVLYHWEGLGPEHRHGDGPLQRHAMVEMVLERKTV